MGKRITSFLLACVLTLSLLPGTARAAESIDITLTVFDQGRFAVDRESRPMLERSVTVTDRNGDGTYSLDEALRAAHEACAPNGAEDYGAGTSSWGYSVTKLWGDASGAFSFYRNDNPASAVNEERLLAGDRVTAFIYRDQTAWSDRYTYFTEHSKTVLVNEEFEVSLNYAGYDGNWAPIGLPLAAMPLGVRDADSGAYSVPDTLYAPSATDSDGKATISFTAPGIYLLTAPSDCDNDAYYSYDEVSRSFCIIPPLCSVTVLPAEDAALAKAHEQLAWSTLSAEDAGAVTYAPTLPTSLTVDEETVAVSWASNDTTGALSVSAWGAYVSRPARQDVSCTLTATLTYNGTSVTKEFPVTVKAEGVSDEKTSVVAYGSLMSGIASGYTTSTNPWVVLAMHAYDGSTVKSGEYSVDASPAAIALANAAIGADVGTLKGIDVSGPYAIYTIPYLELAYQASGAERAPGHDAETLKTAMLSALAEPSGFGVDDIAPILSALAPAYLAGEDAVVRAVDTAVTWLSAQQNSDGTFSYYGVPNANTTALAVVALSALGIDAHRDARFIKSYHSAVEGLLSYALADNSGFGFKGNVTKNALATEQGFRALVSYARFKESGTAYNIYLQAKSAAGTVAAPNITATTTPSRPPVDSNEDLTVSVTIKADTGYWLRSKSVTLDDGSTVYHALLEALDGSGITQSGAESGYVRSMTKDGRKLAEFDQGPDSGWLYKVNGELPDVGLTSYELEDGDNILWYYTEDWTLDPSAGSHFDAQEAADRAAAREVKTLIAAIGTVDASSGAAIRAARAAYDALSKAQQALVPNYDVLLLAEAAFAKLTSALPFTDVADHWALEGITYAYQNGLFQGTGATAFSPDARMTRAMLVTVLYRLDGEKAVTGNTAYADVPADSYCADAVVWAAETGIAGGYGNNRFGAADSITRQQMAVLLYRYAAQKGYDVSKTADLSNFTDAGSIGNYALTAMSWANAEGLVNGRADGTLDPAGPATRAQVATILMRFCENVAR